MKTPERIQYIKNWIIEYSRLMPKEPDSLVVGVSGGIDSSVVSAICSMTEKKTFAVSMPIQQNQQQHNLSLKHHEWLKNKYKNIFLYFANRVCLQQQNHEPVRTHIKLGRSDAL